VVQARFDRILAAFDSAAASPALAAMPQRDLPGLVAGSSAVFD
jgi:hypothetical protein